MSNLDMDLLRAFVHVAETSSFTRAGQMLGASQSAISLKIRKLEDRLGGALLSRSPRSVRLTNLGARFLTDARNLIDLHDRVAMRATGADARQRLHLGISDHAAGIKLPEIIAELTRRLPEHRLHVSVGLSDELYRDFKAGLFGAVMVRGEDVDVPGQTAFEDTLVWAASRSFAWATGRSLPLVALAHSCALRRLATGALKDAGIEYEDAFTGTGVSAVQAAVSAGLGIACLDRRNMPQDCRDVGSLYQLPGLPKTRMVLFTRERSAVGSAILEAFQRNC
ncbi:LysR family transcriptional regulator [Roseibium salinum]|uniref:LysR family transcriptional regulator n=1 Tax=Roseibium salinum TaxID=1604349 RepID=A0ABT3R4Q8_9HYPH|nr:LysR family transcriptional regulator [Roseibium sp. DSM 29163]MCX2724200.1 LysR family transcriptional regulator [Roseibium sp. DSM 29163]MDN3721740.1 LysR family transcriptional regulator [Roseibium salinum]